MGAGPSAGLAAFFPAGPGDSRLGFRVYGFEFIGFGGVRLSWFRVYRVSGLIECITQL